VTEAVVRSAQTHSIVQVSTVSAAAV
jgi:hypothetical protein